MPVSESDLLRYFAARDEQREQEIREAFPRLVEQMRGLLHARRDDPNLPAFLALLIREASVAANARATPYGEKVSKDSVVLHATMETLRTMDDLFPTWRAFDGRNEDDEEPDP